ncbi:MAG: DUF4340 domain-containing protein [candidate division NC10 bacterium]|nr:DUF4340 domain-containing protein [candidate division NC10 bacterium]
MNVRTTLILAILVALLGGYYVWSLRQPKPETGNPTVFAFDDKAVQEVTITRDGRTIGLRRDGETWRLTRPVEARADQAPAAALVASLTLARIERIVEEKPASLADFGLEPPAVTISLKVRDKAEPISLLLGKTSPTGSWVYAKRGDSPAVLMVPATLKGDLEKTPTDLRDKTIVSLDSTKATRIELKSKDSFIVAAKSGTEWWLESASGGIKVKADGAAIDRLVRAVGDLKAKEFVAEGAIDIARYGLTRPDYRVTVSEQDAPTSKTVLIARKTAKPGKASKAPAPTPEPDQAYVAVEGGKQVFLVEGKILEALKRSPLDLRDKRLLSFEIKDVKGLRLAWPDATIALEKEGDNWKLTQPQVATADSGKALDLIYSVNGLRFKDIATEKPGDLVRYGLAKPQVEVTVKKTDNTDLPAIAFGKIDKGKNQLFAKVKNSPIVYVLEPRVLDDLPRDPAKLKKEDVKEKKS